MATDYERVRGYILEKAIANLPRPFVEEYAERARRAYAEVYAEVAAHPATLEHQRIFKLNQDRCFRMDWELYACAKAHGIIATANLLPENQWYHTYAVSGCFGLTQSYVQAVGDLPAPAKFRERLAEASKCPRLPFDDPEEIFAVKEFYALFAHNPVGRTFNEQNQKLGSLMFCVPSKDMRSWSADISVAELLSLYPAAKTARKIGRTPTWKAREKRETGTE